MKVDIQYILVNNKKYISSGIWILIDRFFLTKYTFVF